MVNITVSVSKLCTVYQCQVRPFHSYGTGMKFGGVIYFHDISEARIVEAPATLKNFHALRTMCVVGAEKAITFVTTKWGDVTPEVGAMLCEKPN